LLVCGCGGNGNKVAAASPTTNASTALTGNAGTVYDNIQQSSDWLTCGACGNPGGEGALADYEMVRGISSPSMSGSSAKFSISGPAYTNGYWYHSHPALKTGIKSLRYEFYLYIPAEAEDVPQAIEFQCQQRLKGYVYNFAWQAEYPMDTWRVFNYTAHRWEDSGIPLQRFTPDTWHHIVAEYHNDPTTHIAYHDALTVDGVRYRVNITHAATPVSSQTNSFTNAFQLDLNGRGIPYSVYVDQMRVTLAD
jgi:hypothetical protein